MSDALRLLGMIFTAPWAGLRLVRDRAPVVMAFGLAWGVSLVYCFYTQWQHWVAAAGRPGVLLWVRFALGFTMPLLMLAFVLAPVTLFLASRLCQMGGFRELLRRHYRALLACLFYIWTVACAWALPLAVLAQKTSWRDAVMAESTRMIGARPGGIPSGLGAREVAAILSAEIAFFLLLPFFAGWFFLAVREIFRPSPGQLVALALGSLVLGGMVSLLTLPLFLTIAGSLFLMSLLLIVLHRYFVRPGLATAAPAGGPRQAESATVAPDDAAAQYALGLSLLGRNQLAEARQCFARAVALKADAAAAHYELGRIARAQSHWADAIGHFQDAVALDDAHAHHEIWREIGATYLGAQQYNDARAMLERFLAQRPADPQGLYLLGRAHAGLGALDEARAALQGCLDAADAASGDSRPTSLRWRDEARQFLRSLP